MKATIYPYLLTLLKVLILFFAPIKAMIFLVAFSTILDTGFGIWRAHKVGEKIQSKVFRHGLLPKLLSYVSAIMLIYVSDFFIINDLVHSFIEIDYLSTKLVALVLLSIEVKSIDESFQAVKGWSFLKKFTKLILKAKDIKKKIEE